MAPIPLFAFIQSSQSYTFLMTRTMRTLGLADIFLFDQVQNQGDIQKSQNVRMDGDLASNGAIRHFAWHFLN